MQTSSARVRLAEVFRLSLWLRFAVIQSAILFCMPILLWIVPHGIRRLMRFGTSLGALTDVDLYFKWSTKLLSGSPYGEVGFPYPPLSWLPVLIPRILTKDFATFALLYSAEMATVSALLCALLIRDCQERGLDPERPLRWYTVFLVPLSLMVLWRLDILVACFCFLGYTEWRRKSFGRSASVLAVGTMFKAIPVLVFAALWLPYSRWRANINESLRAAAIFVAICAVVAAGWAFADNSGRGLRVHGDRGLEFGSTYASAYMLWGKLTGDPVHVAFSDACLCYQVYGPPNTTKRLKVAADVIAATCIGLFGLLSLRGVRISLIDWSTLALFVFILAFKVLSPQYLVWLAPFMALLRGPGATHLRLAYLAASMLTLALFPIGADDHVEQANWAVVCLLARNALLIYCAVRVALRSVSTAESVDSYVHDRDVRPARVAV